MCLTASNAGGGVGASWVKTSGFWTLNSGVLAPLSRVGLENTQSKEKAAEPGLETYLPPTLLNHWQPLEGSNERQQWSRFRDLGHISFWGEKKPSKPKPKNNQPNKTFAINYSMLPRLLRSNCPKEYRALNLQIPSMQVQSPGIGKRIRTKERGEPNGFSGGRKLGQSSSRPKR